MILSLNEYLNSDKYLFHGSSTSGISMLTPRQAYSFGEKDGEPAVHATDQLEPALFMAIIGSKKCGGMGKSDLPGFGFFIAESDWQRASEEKWTGCIYVVERRLFIRKDHWEWTSQQSVEVIESDDVSLQNLPVDITIMSDREYHKYRLSGKD